MAEPARRYEREDEVDAVLRVLGGGGLDRQVLSNALVFGEAERRTCTENDPGILKGIVGWGRPIRSLREQLRPKKWRREEPKSLPLVVSPDRSVAITVAAGDDETGNPRASFATTKWGKGNMLCEWVEPSRQMSMDTIGQEESADEPPEERPDLWFLLVRRTPTEILAELSRPTSVSQDDRLRFGGDRIFLKPIPIDQTFSYEDEGDDEEPPAEVQVERI
jgi:hypothetical protein